ncbi:MAG TPA: hypothetical protein VGQ36_19480 [Thermoanaerobaculia bacterium]|jgi:hypothetical protein|nr:hypothetical protein [Thermoanaerobaculia bacterium]
MEDQHLLVFERPPVQRIVSCAAAFGSAAIFFMYLAEHPTDYEALPMIGLVLLFLGTLVAMVLQYGDHIYFSDLGVKYENRLLAWFGKHSDWMRWEDIVEVREVKEKILILLSTDGRRMLVDAILGYAIARAEILRRAPQAIKSGTLAEDEHWPANA